MAYEKQTWVTGEVITKEKLNHMEDGIANGGGVFVIGVNENHALDKTWNEIKNAYDSHLVPTLFGEENGANYCSSEIMIIKDSDEEYIISAIIGGSRAFAFTTNNPDGYPALEGGGGDDPSPTES